MCLGNPNIIITGCNFDEVKIIGSYPYLSPDSPYLTEQRAKEMDSILGERSIVIAVRDSKVHPAGFIE